MSDESAEDDKRAALEAMYPGFSIECRECGSTMVAVVNALGYSATSGAWGSVVLHCLDCHNITDIVTT